MDGQPNFFASLSLIVAPAVLTNASSVLIMNTSNRLACAVDRARELTARLEGEKRSITQTVAGQLGELEAAEQRMLMLIRALRIFYVTLGGFASAALLSLVAAVLSSIVPGTLTHILEIVAVGSGLIAVGGILHGATLLVRETRIAYTVLHERASRLKRQFETREEKVG